MNRMSYLQFRRPRKERSSLEAELAFQLRALAVPEFEREYRFAAMQTGGIGKGVRVRLLEAGLKDWRYDFAWPEQRLAAEVEGGAWVDGRHNRGKGFEDDLEKYHHAASMGWTVYRCGARLVKSGDAARLLWRLLAANEIGSDA